MDNAENINNTLTAGVSPDGLKDSFSIKVLVCYLVNQFENALTPKDIFELCFDRALANYFEVCSVVEELLSSKILLKSDKTEILSLSPDGVSIAKTLYEDLPFTVREKAVAGINKRLARRRHEEETRIDITELIDGYQVSCTLLGSGTEMMTISLYVPDKKYALIAKERFIDDPEYIYRLVFSHLTNEAKLAPEQNND